MARAIITIYISKCAQMNPQQLPKTSKFYSKCKKCDIEKTLGGTTPLVARRLKVIGMFSCIVTLRQISINADFYVIEGKGKSLLGRNTAEQLGVLRVGFVRGINTGQDILAEYPECFEGIGKLKGFKAKFYVNE